MPVTVTGQVHINDQRYAELLLFPVTIGDNQKLLFHSSIEIKVGDRMVAANELLDRDEILLASGRKQSGSAVSGDAEYVVITSRGWDDSSIDYCAVHDSKLSRLRRLPAAQFQFRLRNVLGPTSDARHKFPGFRGGISANRSPANTPERGGMG